MALTAVKVIVALAPPPVIVITSPILYPFPAFAIATTVTAPATVVISTVNPLPPVGNTVVATPVALTYPVPPTKLPKVEAPFICVT